MFIISVLQHVIGVSLDDGDEKPDEYGYTWGKFPITFLETLPNSRVPTQVLKVLKRS